MRPLRPLLTALVLGSLVPAAAQVKDTAEPRAPRSANPYVAFLPVGVVPDYAYWDAELARRALDRTPAGASFAFATVVYDEAEAAGTSGSNDTFDTAEVIAGFGTAADPALTIRGDFAPEIDGTPVTVAPFPEEDGSIPDASDTGLLARGAILVDEAVLGDGAFGATTGDFDFYAVTVPSEGLTLRVDIDTPTGGLDPTLSLFDAAGVLVDFNDDSDGLDSLLETELPAAGTYYVMVSAFSSTPNDVSDPSSGTGAASTGPYDLLLALAEPDADVFAIDLVAGDVLGVGDATASLTAIAIASPDGEVRIGSRNDASGLYPGDSPLPGGGASSAAAAVVAPTTGRYRVALFGAGPYEVGVRAFRPRLEADPGGLTRQAIFLDFDGDPAFDAGIFGGTNPANLSPLSAFIANWGLEASDEDALIDGIVAVVREKLYDDLLVASNNPLTGVDILNSRDHADPVGVPGVSRIVVGGTIDESGVSTIGIASSIDIGNFGTEDVAFVLLDLLSLDDPSDPNFGNSLNQYAVDASASKVDLVAQGVGNITAHEAGHFLGLYHTDQFNATPNIIDQGGNLPNTVGVGPDGIFGTADDVNVDIVKDEFVAMEGFIGFEDGANAVAFGLSSRYPVAAEEAPPAEALRAFPNPIVAGAPLHVEGGAPGARVTLFDALGRRAAAAEAGATGALAVPTAGLAPGAYFLRVDGAEAGRMVAVTVVR